MGRGLEDTGILISYRRLYRCRLFRCFRSLRRLGFISFIISFFGGWAGVLGSPDPTGGEIDWDHFSWDGECIYRNLVL